MLKRNTLIGCFACLFGLATLSHAQAIPAASRSGSIQLGIGGTWISPDYGRLDLKGATFFGDFDFTRHLGIEGDIHYSIITPTDISENSYLLGPRYIFRHGRFDAYGKALFGIGRFGFQQGYNPVASTSTHAEYAFGGGLDVRATRSINIRAFDVDFQKWPNFGAHGLSPVAYTIGAAYVFH